MQVLAIKVCAVKGIFMQLNLLPNDYKFDQVLFRKQ